jgi:DNA-binding GntR family transcriptional regulator
MTVKTLADRATEIIRRSILDLRLEPGSRVDETILMQKFGISRTPAREALNRLAAEDLVRIEANRGASIANLDLMELEAFFDAYFATEQLTAHFCRFSPALVKALTAANEKLEASFAANDVQKIEDFNAGFHRRLIEATQNRFIIRVCLDLQNHARRITQLIYRLEASQGMSPNDQHRQVSADHRLIIDCVASSDRLGLAQAMRAHADQFYERIINAAEPRRGRGFDLTVQRSRAGA